MFRISSDKVDVHSMVGGKGATLAAVIPWFGVAALALFLTLGGCAKKDIVAKVGKDAVTAAEFKDALIQRYRSEEFAAKRTLDERKEILKGLIDEKLKIQDAYRLGLDKDSTVKADAEKASENAAIQELYNVEILGKVIPERVVRDFYDRMGEEIKARHMLFKTMADADEGQLKEALAKAEQAYEQLQGGANFDSLARQISEDATTAHNGGDLGYFGWGRMVDEFQEAAFALKKGEFSKPVKSSYGYHIILLEDRRPLTSRKSFEEEKENIMRMNMMPKYKAELDSMRDKYLEDLKTEFGLKYNYANIQKILDKISDPSVPRNNSLFSDFTEEEKQWEVATTKEKTITVKDLDEQIAKTGAPPKWRDQKAIISVVDRMLIPEFLVKRAQKLGLTKSPKAKEAYDATVKMKVLSLVEQNQITDKIDLSDSALQAYYESHLQEFKTDSTVEVQEIYIIVDKEKSKDQNFANRIAQRAKKGENFTKLVKQYSDRTSAINREGKIGPITSRQYGEMGRTAFLLNIGDVSDPIRMGARAFSIIKLLDKTPARTKDFTESKPQVERQAKMAQSDSLNQTWIINLEQRFKVNIFEDKLMAVIPPPEASEDTTKIKTELPKSPIAIEPKKK
ncbi:MAG: peptidylprolyl isomerase [bacterium]